MHDAVKIGPNMKTSFASSLPGGFHHPIKKTLTTNQVLERCEGQRENCMYDLEAVSHAFVIVGLNRNVSILQTFSNMSSVTYLPHSSTNTAASDKGAWQCL